MVKKNLLDEHGNLNSLGIALCVEKILRNKTDELPVWLNKHLEKSLQCCSNISFLLEHELSKKQNNYLINEIKKYHPINLQYKNSCNAILQVLTPSRNEVFTENIRFEFEKPLKEEVTLYIIDTNGEELLKQIIPVGKTQYKLAVELPVGFYNYVLGSVETTVKGGFYYAKNSIIAHQTPQKRKELV